MMSNIVSKLKQKLRRREQSYTLRIPREEEAEHILLLGDPGTGKTQIIHSFLRQIAARRPPEGAVIYDPACEFVQAHFNAARGDIILNPLDVRFPYWSPAFEVKYPTDRKLLAESFFPGRDEKHATPTQFFAKASRSIFARMLEFGPSPAQIIAWLQDESKIDELVEGTEHALLINPNAGNQRGGVLGSLSDVGDTLKLLPMPNECQGAISLTEWAAQRRGWIFITSKQDTREALRPLHAAFIDLLLKRLMSVRPEWGREHPCWLIVDEVHALKRLPALYTGLVEGRKYGIKIVQGTQGRTQYDDNYGPLARTMLAAPHLKIFMRCGEAESAKWIAETIGDEEREKPKIGTTASVKDSGRDSITYSTFTERRSVISKEQIMALPNMNGYWKYEDKVVGFRFPFHRMGPVAHAFLPRVPKQGDVGPPMPPGTPATPPKTRPTTSTGKSSKAPADVSLETASAMAAKQPPQTMLETTMAREPQPQNVGNDKPLKQRSPHTPIHEIQDEFL
ncbi:MAG: type IV secretion system DNA-binding domain-containing protein [Pyrinomonadaceae bacterium]|nr:type IV secretion system DNA-binding domain-containing protein [Pyrinomonadaceae bacterium]